MRGTFREEPRQYRERPVARHRQQVLHTGNPILAAPGPATDRALDRAGVRVVGADSQVQFVANPASAPRAMRESARRRPLA